MRRIPTKYLKEGSIVATDIYDSLGRLLIKSGSEINEKSIKALNSYNILSVYIIDEFTQDVVKDVISLELRLKAILSLKKMAYEFSMIEEDKRKKTIRENYILQIKDIVSEIINELSGKEALIEQIDIRSLENFNYSHSVNVAIISIILGIELNFDREKLMKLGISAILHEIGKSFLPKELVFKTTELTPEEEKLLESHCALGYEYLSKYGSIDDEICLPVLQHHEKIDGTGYPNKLKEDKISEFSKVIALADFYDELMSSGYMLREDLPSNILEQIMSYVGSSFEHSLVKVLFSKVKPFLKGTLVRLSNGDIARVEGTIKGAPLRPLVKVIKSNMDERINKYINLVDKLDISIVELVYYV